MSSILRTISITKVSIVALQHRSLKKRGQTCGYVGDVSDQSHIGNGADVRRKQQTAAYGYLNTNFIT